VGRGQRGTLSGQAGVWNPLVRPPLADLLFLALTKRVGVVLIDQHDLHVLEVQNAKRNYELPSICETGGMPTASDRDQAGIDAPAAGTGVDPEGDADALTNVSAPEKKRHSKGVGRPDGPGNQWRPPAELAPHRDVTGSPARIPPL
jgi:hypothetical protein